MPSAKFIKLIIATPQKVRNIIIPITKKILNDKNNVFEVPENIRSKNAVSVWSNSLLLIGNEEISSINPIIEIGKHIRGKKLLVNNVAIEPVIEKTIPAPVGVELLCRLLLLGTATANFFKIGIVYGLIVDGFKLGS